MRSSGGHSSASSHSGRTPLRSPISRGIDSFCQIPTTKLLLICLGLLTLCYTAFIVRNCIGGELQFRGSGSYSDAAGDFLSVGRFDSAYRPPLYPLLLASCMQLLGVNWAWLAMMAQATAGITCGMIIIHFCTRYPNGRHAAVIALLLFASHSLYHMEALAKRETSLFSLLITLFFYAATRMRFNTIKYGLLGMLAGLAYLTRPSGVIAIMTIALLWIFESRNNRAARRGLALAATLVSFVAVIAPWQAAVHRITGHLSLSSSTTSGLNIWSGNNPYFDHAYPMLDIERIHPRSTTLLAAHHVAPADEDAFLKERATDYIREHPVRFMRAGLIKACVLFSPVPTPLGDGELIDGSSPGEFEIQNFELRSPLRLTLFTAHALLVFAGILLFTRMARHQFKRFSIPIIVAGAMLTLLTGLHALTFSETRFRLPLDPILIGFAAIGWADWLKLRGADLNEGDLGFELT